MKKPATLPAFLLAISFAQGWGVHTPLGKTKARVSGLFVKRARVSGLCRKNKASMVLALNLSRLAAGFVIFGAQERTRTSTELPAST
jgi:hypothetical protein